jgi:hypothetical protein
MAITVDPQWVALHPFVATLTPHAVGYRYPGLTATKTDAKAAIKDCREICRAVHTSLGLPI